MKTYLLTSLLLLSSISVAHAEGREYQLGVDGLACPFCTYGIEKQLQKLDGVAGLDTDIAQGLVKIHMQEGKSLTEGEAEKAVRKAGFKLRSFDQAR